MRIAIHDYAGHPFIFDLSRELARRGRRVGHFYFKGDKGPKGAVERLAEDPENFSIHPVGIGRDYNKANFITRWMNDITYGISASRALTKFKPDVIVSANTPIESQKIILSTSKRLKSKFLFWMQDFYSLAVKRLLRDRWFGLGNVVSQYYFAAERSSLKSSDHIVYISPDFLESAKIFGVDAVALDVIPNWAPIGALPVRNKANPWSEAHGLADKKVFLYSGTLALKHNPNILRALAETFADDPSVVVVVAARGVGMDRLRKDLEQRPLSSLKLVDLQPIEVLPDMLAAADVLVALLEADAGEFSVPSKVLSYYCAQRPVLMSAPLENLASRTTIENGCGLVAPPGDVSKFLTDAHELLADDALRERMGAQSRRYAEENFNIATVADRFEELIFRMAAAGEPAALLGVNKFKLKLMSWG